MRISLEKALLWSAISQGVAPAARSTGAATEKRPSNSKPDFPRGNESWLAAASWVPGLPGQPNHAAFLSLAARHSPFQPAELVLDQRSTCPAVARTAGPAAGPVLAPVNRLPMYSRLARLTGQEPANAAIDGLPADAVREAVCWLSESLGPGARTLPDLRTAAPTRLLEPVQRGSSRALRQETLLEQVLVALEHRGDIVTTLDGGLNTTEGPYRYHLRRQLVSDEVSPEEAFRTIAAWYIRAFAPATARDLAAWSGLSEAQARRALAAVPQTLRAVEVEGVRGECFVTEAAMAVEAPDQPFCVILPWTDLWLQAYHDQNRFLPEDLPGPVADRDLVLLSLGLTGPGGQAIAARLRVVGSAREPRFQPEPWRALAAFEETAIGDALGFLADFFRAAAPPTG